MPKRQHSATNLAAINLSAIGQRSAKSRLIRLSRLTTFSDLL